MMMVRIALYIDTKKERKGFNEDLYLSEVTTGDPLW